MRQFLTIAANAFMELVRQPVFLLLMTTSVVFEIFLATPYYFAFGDEPKLVKNSTLATMLLAGLFGAVLSASSSLAREIRAGTVLAVLSKPVGRAQFLLAKYAGLVVALGVLVRGQGLLLCGWVATLVGGGVLDMTLKYLIQRPRPVYASPLLHSASWSFPSGHAMGSLDGYGMLAYLLVVCWAERRRTRLTIVVVVALLAGAIGVSRLYLGVHYFSDVVAGYAAGLLWLSACITGLEMARRQRGAAPSWDESRCK